MKMIKKKVGDVCKLSELAVGNIAVIEKISCDSLEIFRHLLDMGITTGVILEIKKVAPLGDPVGIKLRGYELSVRLAELKNVDVRVVR